MAGAGYKLFNTGDVLLASEVNTYLMQQTVMVFADATARTTALSGVLAEGMVSYLQDTNVVEIYNGSAWASLDDPNAIQNTIVDAKGDLISATADNTPARLASSGNNGDVLTIDTSTSTGLKWAAPAAGGDTFAAGKNKIINGAFNIWQRGTSLSSPGFLADRFTGDSDGTLTQSRQSFTAGAAPVAGYESQYFYRLAKSGGTYGVFIQRIEDVRTFANQTVTLSFWGKVNSGTLTYAPAFIQNFGSGGSGNVTTNASSITLTTSWARYSVTVTLPSISGKTIGTSSYLVAYVINMASETKDVDVWGVQLEAGSTATDFQTATGTLAGELAACQRYYYRQSATNVYSAFGFAWNRSSTQGQAVIQLPVRMRVAPTAVDSALLSSTVLGASEIAISSITINTNGNGNTATTIDYSGTSLQSGFVTITGKNDATAYLGFSAEL